MMFMSVIFIFKMESTIRLFKAVPVTVDKKKKPTKALLKKTMPNGFVFDERIIFNYSDVQCDKLINSIKQELILSSEELNNAFHKSWSKIKDANMEELVLDQMMHYITTYGYEHLGIYNKDMVYIPDEVLNIPKLKTDKINLLVIRGYTKDELKIKILNILNSGIALAENTIKDVVEVSEFVGFSPDEVHNIKNKEVKIKLYEKLEIVPENPTEFLRHVINIGTGNSLLIKNSGTIERIKLSDKKVVDLFANYQALYGLPKLAQIFYRFKPLFLAFRQHKELKHMINKIRKLAKTEHKPMKEDYLNSITAKLKNNITVLPSKLYLELSKVNTFRKIRLAYALKYRTYETNSILYKVRNGKGYATDFEFKHPDKAKLALKVVMNSIVDDLTKNVKGKKIFIPENLHYTLPATEKQFTGNFPNGSYISIPNDMIVGIHWTNLPTHRVDLDLSLITADGKIGWDDGYRSSDRKILFSGDITDAPTPNGATELIYAKEQIKSSGILKVNYYNFENNQTVPFKIIIAKEKTTDFKKNYMINPNNIISIAKTSIDEKEKILGLFVTTTNECRFYFSETTIGNSITSRITPYAIHSRNYLMTFCQNMITLNNLLEKAGAILVDEKDKDTCDIDLTPENLEKDTILKLITG